MSKGIYKRGAWWWCKFQIDGHTYREPLRIAVRGAKEERLAHERAIARRAEVAAEAHHGIAAPVSWQAAVVSWHEAAVANRLRPMTIARYLTSLKQIEPHVAALTVQQIDERTIRTIITARRKKGAGNATIRRDLTALSQVLAEAKRSGWRRDNPALDYDRKAVPERRDPIELPREADIAAMIALSPPRFGDLIAFALETGMRQEEIASLQWENVDRKRMVATLTITKGRRVRAVPLTANAIALLDNQPRYLTAGWCFWHGPGERYANPASNFQRLIRRAQKLAQFRAFRFHDLRHLFAVEYLRQARGSIYQLQHVMGHTTLRVTEGYLDYLAPDERAAVMV